MTFSQKCPHALICLCISLVSFSSVKAQVTIGSNIAPLDGTLLELKELNDGAALNGGRTTNKGFTLPRVILTTPSSLVDIPSADAAATPLQYTGLTVYNVGTNPAVTKGLNLWDGTKWVAVQTQPIVSPLKTYIKGASGSSSIALLDLSLIVLGTGSWRKIQFNSEDFDENNEFDTGTSEFTAKQAGIYNIYAQFKASPSLLAAGDLGIGIIKKTGSTYSVVASESFVNIAVALVGNVTPSTRRVQTLVKLAVGDVIYIAANTTIVSATLLGGNNESFFTIQQVK